jgi:hypothetical protein
MTKNRIVGPNVVVTTQYAVRVDDLYTAWAFVMEHVDHVGPDPSIQISPVWLRDDDGESVTRFEVTVRGIQEAQQPKENHHE